MTPSKTKEVPVDTIRVANTKGGCGKTLMACQVAGALALQGLKVQLIDLDPQGGAHTFKAMALENGHEVPFTISRTAKPGFDWTVYDHPPGAPSAVLPSVAANEVILIPTLMTRADYESTIAFINHVQNQGAKFWVFPNRVEAVNTTHTSMRTALFKDPNPYLPKRTGLERAMNEGALVYTEGAGLPNVGQLRAFFDNLMAYVMALASYEIAPRRYDETGFPLDALTPSKK